MSCDDGNRILIPSSRPTRNSSRRRISICPRPIQALFWNSSGRSRGYSRLPTVFIFTSPHIRPRQAEGQVAQAPDDKRGYGRTGRAAMRQAGIDDRQAGENKSVRPISRRGLPRVARKNGFLAWPNFIVRDLLKIPAVAAATKPQKPNIVPGSPFASPGWTASSVPIMPIVHPATTPQFLCPNMAWLAGEMRLNMEGYNLQHRRCHCPDQKLHD